jgi:hypothetical protein
MQNLVDNPKKKSAKVSRILSRFHAPKLSARIPRARRWRVKHSWTVIALVIALSWIQQKSAGAKRFSREMILEDRALMLAIRLDQSSYVMHLGQQASMHF